jgi:hypothetical protein
MAGWHQRGRLLLCLGVTHTHITHTHTYDTYVYTYIHTYIHTYHTYIHTYIRMYKNFLFYFNNIIYINYEVCTYDDQLLQHFHDRPYYVHV